MTQTHTFKVDKLIRDKVSEIFNIEQGSSLICRILNDNEYQAALKKKLIEEAIEVENTVTREELIEELADVMEVLDTIFDVYELSLDDVRIKQKQKKQQRGGFKEKLYCHTASVSEDNTKRLEYYRARPDQYPEVK